MIWNKDQQSRLTLSKNFDTHNQVIRFLLFVLEFSQQAGQFPKITYKELTVNVQVKEGMSDLMQGIDDYLSDDNNGDDNTTVTGRISLYCDGGSRGNPGPAATGYVLLDKSGKRITQGGQYLGSTTNNQAEYKSLVQGLEKAIELGISHLMAYMDSQLVVRQVTGQYKVKNKDIRPVYAQAKDLIAQFDKFAIDYVPRGDNEEADAIVNEILDQRLL